MKSPARASERHVSGSTETRTRASEGAVTPVEEEEENASARTATLHDGGKREVPPRIEACVECLVACNMCSEACLHEEDIKRMVECIRLERDCADACLAALRAMSRNGALAAELCAACAEACDRCAVECERHEAEHCRVCAEACRRCAEECRRMAA